MRTFLTVAFIIAIYSSTALGAPPSKKNVKSKFYDFGEQLIDGTLRTPTGTYTSSRKEIKFKRLLKLKKSFLPSLYRTSKNKIFK